MRYRGLVVLLAVAGALAFATPAAAQRNAFTLNVGYFGLERLGSRPVNDVLVRNYDALLFEISDFDGVTFGGEYLFALNEVIETGVGVNYYRTTVPTVDIDYVEDDGSEIEADLKLRVVPTTFTIRFVPLGLDESLQPYFGGGVGIYRWKYTETGDFVDPSDLSIFTDTYVAEDTDVGGVILGGLRFALNELLLLGGEFRYHIVSGDTGGASAGFLGRKIDLSGFNALFTATVRF